MVYERIHKLCFLCGRIRNRIEACLLTIKKPKTLAEGGLIGCGVEKSMYQEAYQHGTHDSYNTGTSSGTSKDRGASNRG